MTSAQGQKCGFWPGGSVYNRGVIISGSFWRKSLVTTVTAVAFVSLYETTTLDSKYAARQATLRETTALPAPDSFDGAAPGLEPEGHDPELPRPILQKARGGGAPVARAAAGPSVNRIVNAAASSRTPAGRRADRRR